MLTTEKVKRELYGNLRHVLSFRLWLL